MKDKLRKYFKGLKQSYNKTIVGWELDVSIKQIVNLQTFDVKYLHVKEYDLPFRKLNFINNIASFVYFGRVGRRLDLLLYYNEIPLGYIQLASPIMNARLHKFLLKKFGKYDFKLLNSKVVDVSICVPFGFLSKFLSGKLLIFAAMSREIIDLYNQKYNTDIEVLYVTSIFGKASMYNRVRNLKFVGLTSGYHSALTKEQKQEIYDAYRRTYPNRKIKKTALADHIIRLYDHLLADGVKLSFHIPKLQKGVYVCDKFLPFTENVNYWYNRWFLPRKQRILI